MSVSTLNGAGSYPQVWSHYSEGLEALRPLDHLDMDAILRGRLSGVAFEVMWICILPGGSITGYTYAFEYCRIDTRHVELRAPQQSEGKIFALCEQQHPNSSRPLQKQIIEADETAECGCE